MEYVEERLKQLEQQGVSRRFARWAMNYAQANGIDDQELDIAGNYSSGLTYGENKKVFEKTYPAKSTDMMVDEYYNTDTYSELQAGANRSRNEEIAKFRNAAYSKPDRTKEFPVLTPAEEEEEASGLEEMEVINPKDNLNPEGIKQGIENVKGAYEKGKEYKNKAGEITASINRAIYGAAGERITTKHNPYGRDEEYNFNPFSPGTARTFTRTGYEIKKPSQFISRTMNPESKFVLNSKEVPRPEFIARATSKPGISHAQGNMVVQRSPTSIYATPNGIPFLNQRLSTNQKTITPNQTKAAASVSPLGRTPPSFALNAKSKPFKFF